SSNARESENAMRDVLRSALHVLVMDAFANLGTLAFLKAYRGENIQVIDNKFQSLIGKTIEYLSDLNSGAKAMRIGFEYLKQARAYYGDMDGKQRKNDFLDINTA
ncbi:3268_t:CDS:2, partial [Diversispora eburnea]